MEVEMAAGVENIDPRPETDVAPTGLKEIHPDLSVEDVRREALSAKKSDRNVRSKVPTVVEVAAAKVAEAGFDGDPKNLPRPPLPASTIGTGETEKSSAAPLASKLLPPKYRSSSSSSSSQNNRAKYIPVRSSGYGRRPTTRSSSVPRQRAESFDCASDDGSVCSVGSARSASSTSFEGRGAARRELRTRRSRKATTSSRLISSAPSSPASSDQDEVYNAGTARTRSRTRAGLRSQREYVAGGGYCTDGTSNWAKLQKEQQERRIRRTGKDRVIDESTYATIDGTLKRAATERRNSPDARGDCGKAAKISDTASPTSSASNRHQQHASMLSETPVPSSPVTQLKQVTNNLMSSFRSPTRHASSVASDVVPRSFSRKAVVGGGTPNTIGRKLFDDRTKTMLAEYSNFDSKASAVRKLAEDIFAPGTGITDEEILKALNTRPTTGARQWELKKKLEVANDSIKHLKATTNLLLRGKNRFLSGAIDVERTTRAEWERTLHIAKIMDEERTALKKSVAQLGASNTALKDDIKDTRKDLELSEEKIARLEEQIGPLKEKLAAAEKAYTDASIALAVLEAKSEESSKQAEGWRAEVAAIEKSKHDAVKQAETDITAEKERELTELRKECASLRIKMEAREEDLCRLVGVESVATGSSCHFDGVKNELDKLRTRTVELESILSAREAELERTKAENLTAIERALSKDRDMSELAKGLREVQQSGQAREEEANRLRKDAEAKAAEMERLCTEARHEISVLYHDKDLMNKALTGVKKELVAAEESILLLKNELAEMKAQISSQSSLVLMEKELRGRAEQNVEEERRERIACSAQMVAMTQEHARVQAKLKEENIGLERHLREKIESLRDALDSKDEELLGTKQIISGLEAERDSLKEALNDKKNMADAKSVEEIGQLMGEIKVLKERLKAEEQKSKFVSVASGEKVAALETQIREGQAERRRMHNLIQELRGNVRVFARVRPFLPNDGVAEDAEPFVIPKNETTLKLIKGDDEQEYTFSFDRVFPPSVGQEAVFEEVSELVQSALDGYNVCLFSYGQTGSGKTHTMQGSGSGAMRGIIPRSIQQVGRYKKELERDGWQYDMRVSFCEIYNETIRDLLRDGKSKEFKHEVKVDSEGQRFITDLTMRDLDPNDVEAVDAVMREAAKHRSVASTDMNEVSSRSHSVFTLHLIATNAARKEALKGTLNLVDLAGSERLDRSGATGARAKEAVSINKSLSALTSVFVALGRKAGHIPFRDSKLTYLLQPCLSGDGKTLMICNVSPTELSAPESLCSLRFACQVNRCELGQAKKQVMETPDETDRNKRTQTTMYASSRNKMQRLGC